MSAHRPSVGRVPSHGAAPTGRKKIAQGKEPSDAALGHESQHTSSPEGAKDGSDLPNGWRWTNLGELKALSLYGPRFSSDDYRDSGVFVLRTTDISESGKVVTSRAPHLHLTDDDLKRYQLKRGDLLITRTGSLGTLAVFNDDVKAIAGAYLIQYRLSAPPITSWYVFYALKSPAGQSHLVGRGAGVGRPNLNAPTIEAFAFPLPPEDEQRRIVSEIEKQFTRLEAGVAALRRVQANLKRYRAAVLKAACEGRLVPTEAELSLSQPSTKDHQRAYESGEALLARILTERRKNWERNAGSGDPAYKGRHVEAVGRVPSRGVRGRGKYKEPAAPDTTNLPQIAEGWTWASVEQLGDVQLGRQRSPKNVSKNYPTKYIRAANITERGIDVSDVLEMEFSPAERERFALRNGDIMLSEASGSPSQVGKPAVWRGELELCCFQNTVLRLRPAVVGSKFVLVAFQHCFANGIFAKVAGGVGINHLGAEKFSAIPFPLPPLAEQTRIVAEVERRLSVVDELEAVVSANLQRATRLRQSILQKAFNGQLG